MTPRTVLCFGDSNTYGMPPMRGPDDWRRFPADVRWPGVLAARLGTGWRVVEEGLPGRTTCHPDPIEGAHKNGFAFLPALLESHRPFDLLVVMLGTNDLKARFSLTPEDIAAGVGRIAEAVRLSPAGEGGRAPRLLVVAPVPIEETGFLAGHFRGGATPSRQLGAAIENVAARLGAPFLDAGAHASVSPVDGVHLDAPSHRAIGEAVAARVAQLFADEHP